jgi:predicted RNase H-like HicB family nuclease
MVPTLQISTHKEDNLYVAVDAVAGVASQGKSRDEALENFKEAFELWFENAEEWEKQRASEKEFPQQ